MGNEPYYIDKITDYISEKVLPESEKAFNQTVLYGKDIELGTLLNTARRFPMMSNYHVVIIKEAQNIKGIDGSVGKGKNPKPNPFVTYMENPPKSTILVINYKYDTIDRRSKFSKNIDKFGVLFESKKLYDNQLPQWISGYLSDRKYRIDPKAAALMAEFMGSDLCKIANEIEKLLIVLPENSLISPEIVEKYIGISHEYNVFELNKALAIKDILRANRIANYLGKNMNEMPLFVIVGNIFEYFVKILKVHANPGKGRDEMASVLGVNPFFTEEYFRAAKNYSAQKTIQNIKILRQFELKAKGVDSGHTEHTDLLKELVFKLMH
jgi:DNA polymerase-3 subunit delta